MGANDQSFKKASINAINTWTYAEMGEKKAKKAHKHDMRRRKRTTEKQQLRRDIDDALLLEGK